MESTHVSKTRALRAMSLTMTAFVLGAALAAPTWALPETDPTGLDAGGLVVGVALEVLSQVTGEEPVVLYCDKPQSWYATASFNVGFPSPFFGTAGNDLILGTINADTIHGMAGDDCIYGFRGNDQLYGDLGPMWIPGCTLFGHDTIFGGNGNDFINGCAGNDKLYGEAGNDRVVGADHEDFIWGGSGDDSLYGDAGRDILWANAGKDYLDGGLGNSDVGIGVPLEGDICTVPTNVAPWVGTEIRSNC